MDKTPEIDSFTYKLYLMLFHMFVSVETDLQELVKTREHSQCFTRCAVKLLHKNKHDRNKLINFAS